MKVTQSYPTLRNPMVCSLPGSSVHGILQARILDRVVGPLFRGSSQPRYWTQVFCTAGGFFIVWATREDQIVTMYTLNILQYYLPILPQKKLKLKK